jgi:hypothetical protein
MEGRISIALPKDQLAIKFQIQHNQQCRRALQMNSTILVVRIQQIAGISQWVGRISISLSCAKKKSKVTSSSDFNNALDWFKIPLILKKWSLVCRLPVLEC